MLIEPVCRGGNRDADTERRLVGQRGKEERVGQGERQASGCTSPEQIRRLAGHCCVAVCQKGEGWGMGEGGERG